LVCKAVSRATPRFSWLPNFQESQDAINFNAILESDDEGFLSQIVDLARIDNEPLAEAATRRQSELWDSRLDREASRSVHAAAETGRRPKNMRRDKQMRKNINDYPKAVRKEKLAQLLRN
jgi:hypothetical protein